MRNIIKIIIPLAVFLILLIVSIFSFNNENNVYHGIYDSNKNYFETDTTIAIMYETDNGNYEVSDGTSWLLDGYKFNESLSGCENGGTISWNDATQKVEMKTNISDKCYVYFDIKPLTFAEHIINNIYTADGENGLYYHDGIGSYTNADQEAGDNSYRYSGADPINYVCFGSNEATCPDEYLYRIIGVFDEDSDEEYNVKLIKADYTTSNMLGTDGRDYYGNYNNVTSNYKGNMNTSTIAAYRWNYDTSVSSYGSNNWTTSELNKINLNINYITYLSNLWSDMIEDTIWYLGGLTSNGNIAKSFYTGERNNAGYGSNPTTYGPENANGSSTKIGLMYVSDYGYAAYPDAWVTNLGSYSSSTIKQNNWLYMGLYEWTMTPYSSNSYLVFGLYSSGNFGSNSANYGYSVRPVFYLKSSILYASGDGTKDSPFRVGV